MFEGAKDWLRERAPWASAAREEDLPSDFLLHLIDLTEKLRAGKAGFALDVSEPEKMTNEIFQIGDVRCRIWE